MYYGLQSSHFYTFFSFWTFTWRTRSGQTTVGFCSTKWPGVFLLSPQWHASYSIARLASSPASIITFADTPWYTWVKKDTELIKCSVPKHDTTWVGPEPTLLNPESSSFPVICPHTWRTYHIPALLPPEQVRCVTSNNHLRHLNDLPCNPPSKHCPSPVMPRLPHQPQL